MREKYKEKKKSKSECVNSSQENKKKKARKHSGSAFLMQWIPLIDREIFSNINVSLEALQNQNNCLLADISKDLNIIIDKCALFIFA